MEDADGTDGLGNAIYGYLPVEDNQEIIGTTGDLGTGLGVRWGPLKLSRGQTFTKTIKRMRVTDEADTFMWRAHFVVAPVTVPDNDTQTHQ